MAVYDYPLTLAEFFNDQRISTASFGLGVAATMTRTGGGAVIRHRIGERLWRGSFQIAIDYHAGLAEVEALVALLQEPGASFLVHDERFVGPAYDPDGSILGASTPSILAIPSAQELRLQGLPVGYEIRPGDLIGYTYGSDPTRYALHRAVTGATAGGAGQTAAFQVVPTVPDGAAASDPVTLIRPPVKARLVSAEYGSAGPVITQGPSLQWVQTLR